MGIDEVRGVSINLENTTTAGSGMLTLVEMNALFQSLYENARAEPDVWVVSPCTVKRLRHFERVGKVNRAHPLPQRTLRKCHMRRVIARRQQGMARIARIEQREERAEAEFLKHVREDSSENWATYVSATGLHDVRTVVIPPIPIKADPTLPPDVIRAFNPDGSFAEMRVSAKVREQ
jgi:hypothetical protein